MTGAGSATVAFAKEQDLMGSLVDGDSDGNPEYYLPGRNITVDEIEARNALERLTLPDQTESVESIAGQFETGLSASWAMSADRVDDVHDIVFNGAGQFVGGDAASTSAWFIGLNHLSGKAERALVGVWPTEYSIEYSQDSNTVTETLTMVAADESENTSFTPSNIQSAGEGQTVPFHGAQLDIDAATQTALQSFTLTISNIAQPITGATRHPLDAVVQQPETTLDFTAIMKDGPDQLDYVYGQSGDTEPQDQVDGVPGTITLDVAGTTAATFNLSNVTLNTAAWEELISKENTVESATAHVNGITIS